MRIVVLPMDETACGSYRCIWPASVIQKARPDWEIEIYQPGAIKMGVDHNDRLAAIMGLDVENIDLLVTQRLGTPRMLQFMRLMQSKGTAVILDADDALWCIHRDNAAYRDWNGDRYHWTWMDQAAKEADLVTVTTERLGRRYGKHGRVEVLPNRVPAAASDLYRPESDEIVDIGWSGWVGTHPADLHVLGDAVAGMMAHHDNARVTVVGDGQGIISAWGLEDYRERTEATGVLSIDDYFDGLTRLDVGLVPLESSVFNNCKSSLKAAEYAAVGVPVIASPTPANLALAREGYEIRFASTPQDWYEHLEFYISNPWDRGQVAQGLLEAAHAHSMENHIEEWVGAWSRAVSRRRAVAR